MHDKNFIRPYLINIQYISLEKKEIEHQLKDLRVALWTLNNQYKLGIEKNKGACVE